MNTKLQNNKNGEPDFHSFFEFDSKTEETKHDARMIMYRFLSELERIVPPPKRGVKKMLAESIGKSQSYITQLFNGDKLINLITLAKFEKALKIKFKITAYPESEYYSDKAMIKNIFMFKEVSKTPSLSFTEGITKEGDNSLDFGYTQYIQNTEPQNC